MGRHTGPTITIMGRAITIPRGTTGVRLAIFITTILVGTTGTGGAIIGIIIKSHFLPIRLPAGSG
jgi:hypothetical protein